MYVSFGAFATERPYFHAKIGGGTINGSLNTDVSDLQLTTDVAFLYPVFSQLDIEIGGIGTGSLPFFSDLFNTDTADYTHYYLGIRAHYPLVSWLDIFVGGGVGYGKVIEYAPVISSGVTTYNQLNEYTGTSYYASGGIIIQPFKHLGLSISSRYDKLPQDFSGTNILFGLEVYF